MKQKILLVFCITFVTITKHNLFAQSWTLTGNAGTLPSTNFIGTTDNKDFIIRTKNIQRLRISSTGNILIGPNSAPIAKLEMRNNTEINSMYISNSSTNSNQYGFRTVVNGTNASAFRTAGEFSATGAGSNNTGLTVSASAATLNYGGNFNATDGATSNIAVWGYTGGPGGSTNYAVYGSIAGFSTGNDFAGYFKGRTYVSSSLVIGTSETPSNASVTINSLASVGNSILLVNSNSSGNGIQANYSGSPANYYAVWGIAPASGSNQAGYFSGNVTVSGTFSNPSDERLKENINPLSSVTDKIMLVSVNTYNFKKEFSNLNLPQVKQYGFLAQNLQKIFPELVQTVVDKSKGENNLFEYKTVNYLGMIPILTKALQEEHTQRIQTEQELQDLKQRLQNIEALLSPNSTSSQSVNQKTLNTSEIAKLDQNAPNPFNQKSTISCFIPSNTKNAMVVVYSANGTNVKTFNNLNAGTNRLDITANTLAGGVYTYVLLIDGKQADSRQMIITK
jgi:hypothetical protein